MNELHVAKKGYRDAKNLAAASARGGSGRLVAALEKNSSLSGHQVSHERAIIARLELLLHHAFRNLNGFGITREQHFQRQLRQCHIIGSAENGYCIQE